MPLRWHADDRDLLLQAIEFTAREAGFNPRLIERTTSAVWCSNISPRAIQS